tara:strand:- start:1291 stop:1719 length:429 start_codon:yes stop_codon:yes gene_type:complete
MSMSLRNFLGYAGLIPFLFFSVSPLLISFPEGYVFNLLLSFYGGVILSFLGGMTWGWSLDSFQKSSLTVGVLVSLIGFFIISISNMFLYYSLCLSLATFISFYLFELRVSDLMKDKEYKRLRTVLTFVVSLCYLLSITTFGW